MSHRHLHTLDWSAFFFVAFLLQLLFRFRPAAKKCQNAKIMHCVPVTLPVVANVLFQTKWPCGQHNLALWPPLSPTGYFGSVRTNTFCTTESNGTNKFTLHYRRTERRKTNTIMLLLPLVLFFFFFLDFRIVSVGGCAPLHMAYGEWEGHSVTFVESHTREG